MRSKYIEGLLLLALFLATGCDSTPDVESQNICAILSPDGSHMAFARSFRYYTNKASVFDPGGWEESVFEETSLYILNRSTEKLTKFAKLSENRYYCDEYYCPVNISWENDTIAHTSQYAIHIVDLVGNPIGNIDFSRERLSVPVAFTLSGDAQKVYYVGMHPDEYDRQGLYSINLYGEDKTYMADLGRLGFHRIYDMVWDSGQNWILIAERSYNDNLVIWQIAPDGSQLEPSVDGLEKYLQRRLGGWESDPPFDELEKLVTGISHEGWDIPDPDGF